MATIVLSAVGSAFGPVGAAIGGFIGNSLDRATIFKPKGRVSGRLSDLQIQTSSYGTQVPKIFGSMRVAGTVIWATDLQESKTKNGGGKGQPSVTSYSYSVSFAVALSSRPINGIKRIWADGKLLRGEAGDFKTALGGFRVHKGGEDQNVDPLIMSAEGVGATSGNRGMAYVVFEDLALADYGNRIPSLTFEVEADNGPVSVGQIATSLGDVRLNCDVHTSVSGFVAQGEDIDAALSPLVEMNDLAFVSASGNVKLVSGSDAPVTSLGQDGLSGRVNGKTVSPIERVDASVDTVPLSISILHHDPDRDYQAGVQKVSRPGSGRREKGVELPVSISATKARHHASQMIDRWWVGRSQMTIRGGWHFLTIHPADVVVIEGERGLWRVEEREWEAMGVRLQLRQLPNGKGLSSGVTITGGRLVKEMDQPHGETILHVVDLPSVRGQVETRPLLMAMASGGAGWRGASLFEVSSSGEALPAGRTAGRATLGRALTALGVGSSLIIDRHNSVIIQLISDDMHLYSADAGSLSIDRNLCMIGDELIQFERAYSLGEGRFRLDDLRRGLFGTEWAMDGHRAGDAFQLIEADVMVDVLAASGGSGDIGAKVQIAAVGIGDTAPVISDAIVYGRALIPPSPVHMVIEEVAEGIKISWTRRSRQGWQWRNNSDVPLAEERERYQLRILDGETMVRSTECDEPAFLYEESARREDVAAAVGSNLTVEVRQIGTYGIGVPTIARLSR